jgi:transcriptional antiterminator RfaH
MHHQLDRMGEAPVCSGPVAFRRSGGCEAWYCLRTHLKREPIAAAQLRQDPETEVFLPRIRYEKSVRSGRVWVTEALFPNYLFARFDLAVCGRRIRHARAIRDMVHFGSRYPAIPDLVIEELRSAFGDGEMCVIESSFDPGQPVRIAGGPFHDLEAVVTRAMPRQHRVAVLLDFLGRQTTVELDGSLLVPESGKARLACLACA